MPGISVKLTSRRVSKMNLAFSTDSTRNPASQVAVAQLLREKLMQKRLNAAVSLRRRWRSIVRLAIHAPEAPRPWRDYLRALAVSGLCTAIAFPLSPYFGLVNIVMLYLLATAVGALRLGRGPSVLLAIINMLAFDYFFVPPRFSFDVEDTQYLFALGVMLIVALVIANLMVSIRHHREIADTREQRTAVLYAMSRELAVATDARAMAEAAVRHICAVFDSSAVVLMTDARGQLLPLAPAGESACEDAPSFMPRFDLELARDVVARGERCIKDAIYLPLRGSRRINGVIVVCPQPPARALPSEQLNLLDTFAAQLALSLQRARLAEAAEAARISAERVLLRNTLLASISHDLRTPLSAIAGAGSLIAQPEYALNADRRTTLGRLIEQKARDMSQLLTNVLDLVQMEFGSRSLRADWHVIDDLVALALRANEARMAKWRINLELPADLPLILVEPTLIVQILSNLLENAAKYTPPGTTITIGAAAREEHVSLTVADDGPGLPPGDPEQLFEKFQRGRSESNVVGVGLGLAICRAAARLHRGDIRATNNPGGGARFEIILPLATESDETPALESC
jgi:two-component system, OmpR family, sensor histidine kinase KdpD